MHDDRGRLCLAFLLGLALGCSATEAGLDKGKSGDGSAEVEDPHDARPDGKTAAKPDATGPDAKSDAPALPTDGDVCAAAACSGAMSDGCCPAACNAANDKDCAGCGNGTIESGETCDPPSTCAQSCPMMGCMRRRLEGAGTCNARCIDDGLQTQCLSGDGCCPPGCNAANDSDCSVTCGNGVLEGDERCDPLSSCPQSCPSIGCTLRAMAGSGCQAHCTETGTQTACQAGDGCCPPGCNEANDADCKVACGNGVVESGETCDPLASCPQACPPMGCNLRRLLNPGTCAAACVDAGRQTACKSGDECCPAGCNHNTDADCPAVCGNKVVEAGETCDPPSACVAQQSACTSDTNTVRTGSGDPALCTYVCTSAPRGCGPSDGFCPANCGPTQDSDCPGCGNGRKEKGETCDPPGTCPTTCPSDGDACTKDQLTGKAAACTAACVHTPITACVSGDGCCAPNCTPAQDHDCKGCGNGVIEMGETCDPPGSCPTACADDGDPCTTDVIMGSADACTATCVHTPITTCKSGDGCCAPNCAPADDNECKGCGNGMVEAGETCDPPDTCPTTCADDGDPCTADVITGSARSCTAKCVHTAITACTGGDKCCPQGCNSGPGNLDSDCPAVCGNGAVEGKETCDPQSQTLCPSQDECLKMSSCELDAVFGGDPAACTATCTITDKACATGDGCCPSRCDSSNDGDCPPPNDQCPGAMDISEGGNKFPIDLRAATAEPGTALCSQAGSEVFYKFKLADTSLVYLDALDQDKVASPVPLTIELYAGTCGQVTPIGCDSGESGQKLCGREPFPRIDSGGAGSLRGQLKPGDYLVVVRGATKQMNDVHGQWTLTFNFTPADCAAQGRVAVPGTAAGDLCGVGNETSPDANCRDPNKKGTGDHGDANYVVYRCPGEKLRATTSGACPANGAGTDTLVSVWEGGARIATANPLHCVPAGAPSCNDDATCTICGPCIAACCPKPVAGVQSTVDLPAGASGIATINVDGGSGLCNADGFGAPFTLTTLH